MKLPPLQLWISGAAVVLGATLSAGCPSTPCPNCTLKSANFTITPQEGTIIDVVMKSTGEFKGHCAGKEEPAGCVLHDQHSLGVLPENEPERHPLPWESDDATDTITVKIDVLRRTERGTTVQNPPVTISR